GDAAAPRLLRQEALVDVPERDQVVPLELLVEGLGVLGRGARHRRACVHGWLPQGQSYPTEALSIFPNRSVSISRTTSTLGASPPKLNQSTVVCPRLCRPPTSTLPCRRSAPS